MNLRLSFWLRLLAVTLLALAGTPAVAANGPFADKFAAASSAMITDPGQALEIARALERESGSIADQSQRRTAVATAQWMQAEALLRLNRVEEAAAPVEHALALIEPIKGPLKLRADLLLSRGGIETGRSEPALALATYQQAFSVFQALHEPRSQAIALQYIASLYREANDFARAEQYYRQSSDVYAGDKKLSLATHNNRGNVLRQMQRFADAEVEYRAALDLAHELDSRVFQALILTNLARLELESGKTGDADQTITEGLRIAAQGQAGAWGPQIKAVAAQSALAHGQIGRAVALIGEVFDDVDLTQTDSGMIDAHDIAYEVYDAAGQPQLALAHLEAVRRLEREATSVAASTNSALMSARFDFQNQELRITRLKADELSRSIEFERAQARLQQIIFISISVAVTVLIGLLVFGIVTLRRSRDQVRAANIELGETNTALEKALAAKTEFLATTSHEIRTPLNGILGMTQVMLADRSIAADMRDRINVVHGAGVTMRALVDDILDVAKMETGNLTVERVPTDLTTMLRDATRMWSEQAEAKGLSFTLDLDGAPRWIESDPSRLRQVIYNLLSNALKFTESGSVAMVARAVAGGAGETIEIAVTDTGIGIDPDKFDEVFESFKQADSRTTRKFGGTGLGLSICRNLARALGGDVRLDSTPGTGSTFTISLPLVHADAQDASGNASDVEQGSLLVLDRNPIARSMLKTLLQPQVGVVRFAGDVAEAEGALGEGRYLHLLIDEVTVRGETDDVPSALERLSIAARASGTPTAILWARPGADDIALARNAGIDACIAKPIGGAALVKAIFGDASETTRTNPLVSHAA